MVENTVWLARGACGACGRPLAKRLAEPGEAAVRCQVCGATTTIAARGSGPPVAPPVAPPAAPSAGSPPARAASPRALAIGGVLAGIAIVAAVALLALGLAGAGPFASLAAVGGEWRTLETPLLVATVGESTTFRFDVAGFDADGNEIPDEDLVGVPAWWFASSGSLVERGAALEWVSCDPRTCAFDVPTGEVAYFSDAGGAIGSGTFAFHTGNGTLFQLMPVSGWRVIPDGEAYLATLSVVAAPLTDENRVWMVDVLVRFEGEGERDIVASILQGGETLAERRDTVDSIFGSSSSFPSAYQSVGRGEVLVRVEDPVTKDAAEETVRPDECQSGMDVVFSTSATGAITFVSAECE